jgi:hypothetical protein
MVPRQLRGVVGLHARPLEPSKLYGMGAKGVPQPVLWPSGDIRNFCRFLEGGRSFSSALPIRIPARRERAHALKFSEISCGVSSSISKKADR